MEQSTTIKHKSLSGLLLILLFSSVVIWPARAGAVDYNDIASGNWNSSSTWSPSGIPGVNDNVTVDSHTVTLTAEQFVNDITIAGGTFNGGSSTLNVRGDWNSTGGTFNPGTSTIAIGTNGQSNTITTDPVIGRIFNNLTINAGAYISADPLNLNGFRVDGIFTISGTFNIPQNITIYARWNNNLIINPGGELTGPGTYSRDVDASAPHMINDGTISIDTFQYRVREWGVAQPITATTYGNNLVVKNLGSSNWNSYLGCATEPVCPPLVVQGNFYLFDDRISIWFPGVTVTLDNSIYDIPVIVNGDIIFGVNIYTASCSISASPPVPTAGPFPPGSPSCGCGVFITGDTTITVGGNLVISDNQPTTDPRVYDCDTQIIATDGTPVINVAGDVIIGNSADNGEATFDAGASSINVGGSWDASYGIFDSDTSTVTFNGTGPQNVTSGGSAFNNVEIANSSEDVTFTDDLTATNFTSNTFSASMKFNAGSTYTITNLFLNGSPGAFITLDSTAATHDPGDRWNLIVTGSQSLSYVKVSDSDASGGNQITCMNCMEPYNNNINWDIILPIPAPTMTEWGVIIFMVLAGLGAGRYLRKQKIKN